MFSEYHAVGAATGAFMIRKGAFKYVHYVGMPPQLFDLEADPWERHDLGTDPGYAGLVADCETELRRIVDPGGRRPAGACRPGRADRRVRRARGGDRPRQLRLFARTRHHTRLRLKQNRQETTTWPPRPAPRSRGNRWTRILGVAFIMYVLSFVDRTNIAMAIPAMRGELGLSQASIGFATSVFFWGYLVLQIPSGRLAGVWSAKRVIGGLLVLWSIVSLSTALVHSETELILNRFALGLTEGGVLTCTIVLIRAWFSRAERARANMVFLASLAVAPMIANPISGLILSYSSWRTMFVIEALPALAWVVVWWWAIDNSPRQATWMPEAERAALLATLDAEAAQVPPQRGHWLTALLTRQFCCWRCITSLP